MSQPVLHIEANDPIPKKIKIIQEFLGEHYFDDQGLMYSNWYWKGDELRPARRKDFTGQSVFNNSDGLAPEGVVGQENSPSTAGQFLWSQCLRYQATGEEQALDYAAKAYRSLEIIFELTEAAGQRGFICKPYSHQASKETSPDQYTSVMLGLWAYREIANRAVRQRIDYLLPAMADWWRERNYQLVFFENKWTVLPNDVEEHGPGFIALNLMAHHITGKAVYRNEATRILALAGSFGTAYQRARRNWLETGKTNWPELLHGCEYDVARRPFLQWEWEGRSVYWLAAASVDFLLGWELSLAPLLKHALANYYSFVRGSLRPDLLTWYWFQTDLERNTCHPLVRPRGSGEFPAGYLMPFKINFYSYQSEVCYGDAALRVADVAVMAHQHAPEFSPGAVPLAKALLQILDDRRLHHMIDPDGRQVMPEDQWMCNALSSDTPLMAILAWWRAKVAGIEL